jgi:hypothetical protein
MAAHRPANFTTVAQRRGGTKSFHFSTARAAPLSVLKKEIVFGGQFAQAAAVSARVNRRSFLVMREPRPVKRLRCCRSQQRAPGVAKRSGVVARAEHLTLSHAVRTAVRGTPGLAG